MQYDVEILTSQILTSEYLIVKYVNINFKISVFKYRISHAKILRYQDFECQYMNIILSRYYHTAIKLVKKCKHFKQKYSDIVMADINILSFNCHDVNILR